MSRCNFFSPLMLALAAACGGLEGNSADIKVGTTKSGLIADPHRLPDVPGSPLPAGYGTYCSVTDPSNGGWAFTYRPPNSGDPCVALAAIVGPNTIVRRAGVYAENGGNNVMARCDGGFVTLGRAYGQGALDWIFGTVPAGRRNCYFIVAPTELPVWGVPFDTDVGVTGTSVYDYNLNGGVWDIAQFGMAGGDGEACAFDRTGFETRSWSDPTCRTHNPPAAQPNLALHADAFEGAYDWSMTIDTPIYAVADGIIRNSRERVVWPICGPNNQTDPFSPQLELFLETQVGSGQYAEHFIAAYHHMNPNPTSPLAQFLTPIWGGPMPPTGTFVSKGEIIGFIGSSGCSGGPHLDFSVERLTNLTGGRAFPFAAIDTTYSWNSVSQTWNIMHISGVNGFPGSMDPFGWAAPANVDPLSWMLIGKGPAEDQDPSITDRGTFSIEMFTAGWAGAYLALPHNGGNPS